MTRYWSTAVAAALALATFDAAFAGSKHRHAGARHRGWAPVAVGSASSFEPARMIEVRPGLIISSYDCVIDEGYGRFIPCSVGGGKR
jgi:hypothetical protein